MTTLSALKRTTRPPRVAILSPSAFADTWESKPTADVAVGLRLLSERELQTAKAEASKSIEKMYVGDDGEIFDHEKAVEAWNDALVRWAVAYATCDPNDVTKPYFDFAEDVIAVALTPQGIRRLWDEWRVLVEETSPLSPELDAEGIASLVGALCRLDALPPSAQRRVRRLLGACLTELGA